MDRQILKLELNGKVREIVLGGDELKQFKTKFQSIGLENSIEEFIINDLGGLLENELYETYNNQLFNY